MANFNFLSGVAISFTNLLIEIPNGTKYTRFGDEGERILYRFQRIESAGGFNINNGVLAIVDDQGCEFITPCWNDSIIAELKKAGYQRKDLFVPFSNGECFLDDMLQERWKSIWGVARIMRHIEQESDFLAECQKSANLTT